MVKQLTDEDYALFGDRADSPGDPGMQPLTEEGLAALEQAPPEPSQEELVEAAVAGYVPPESGSIPGWAKEWGYLPQKAWDQSYYDIPIARLMDFPGERGGRVHTVHEGDYVEGLGTVSTISMDPNGFHVSVEIAPDDKNTPTFWIGGEPKDPGAVLAALSDDDLDLLDKIVQANGGEAADAAQEQVAQTDSQNRILDPDRVLQEFSDAVATQHLIYGIPEEQMATFEGLLDSMTKADLSVMTGDATTVSTTSHQIDETEWTRHDMAGRDGQQRVFYEDPETGRVINATIPATATEGPAERAPSGTF